MISLTAVAYLTGVVGIKRFDLRFVAETNAKKKKKIPIVGEPHIALVCAVSPYRRARYSSWNKHNANMNAATYNRASVTSWADILNILLPHPVGFVPGGLVLVPEHAGHHTTFVQHMRRKRDKSHGGEQIRIDT